MAVNQRVFDTAIAYRTQNSRAVTNNTANGANNLYFISPDGVFYVLAGITGFDLSRMKTSTDNGFTWSNITYGNIDITARTDNVAEGPTQAFFQNEAGDYYFITCSNGQIWFYRTSTQAYDTWYGQITTKYSTWTDTCLNNFFATTGDGNTLVYMAYLNASKDLKMLGMDFNRTLEDIPQDFASYGTTNWASGVLACKGVGATVHTIAVMEDIPDMLCYIPFTKKKGVATGSWGTYKEIASGTMAAGNSSWRDLAIDIDGSGNIGCVYSKRDSPEVAISGYSAISRDNGTTWSGVYHAAPAGYSGCKDQETGKLTLMCDIIGGYSGSFLISNVFMKDGSGTLFVKEIPSYGNGTDTWHQVNSVSGNVLGGKFFKYTDEAIPNFGDKYSIRMAYQLGSTNSAYGNDTVYSRIYHERLSNLAYPLAYSGTAFTKDNIDYYASGYIDDKTALYISKINDLGMVYSFSRFDPNEDSVINGQGGYFTPTTFEDQACVDPGSYGFATVARNNADFSDYIERDTRKLFYKPNLYLPRNFVLNKGGYLKRTIYTVRIMGNDYEVAQIVPRFLDGKILYYEANLYVIGPSNDPFSKVILPSES